MENYKTNLRDFIDSTIKDDNEGCASAFNPYITQKFKELLAARTAKPATISESAALLEFDGSSPIKLHGNDVLVNGKKIGVIKNDIDDFDSGISFVSSEGTFSKEFEDIQSLYSFLATKYIGKGA